MTLTSLLPVIAASLFLLFALYVAAKGGAPMKNIWLLPAALSLLFLLFSVQQLLLRVCSASGLNTPAICGETRSGLICCWRWVLGGSSWFRKQRRSVCVRCPGSS